MLNLYGCKSPSEFKSHRFRVITKREVLEEELALAEYYIAFLDRYRSRGGLLVIPDEFVYAEGESNETSFEEELVAAMMEPLDPNSTASCFLPIIIRGPEALTDKIRHIEFDSTFRDILCGRAYDIKAQIELLDKDE